MREDDMRRLQDVPALGVFHPPGQPARLYGRLDVVAAPGHLLVVEFVTGNVTTYWANALVVFVPNAGWTDSSVRHDPDIAKKDWPQG